MNHKYGILLFAIFLILGVIQTSAYTSFEGIETNDEVNMHYILTYDGRVQQDNKDFTTIVSPNNLIEGFYLNLLGMTVGETKIFDVPPERGYSSGDLVGKVLKFEVTINAIVNNIRGNDYVPPESIPVSVIDFADFQVERNDESQFENFVSSPIVLAISITSIVIITYLKFTGSSTSEIKVPKEKSKRMSAQDKLQKRMEEVEKKKY